MAFVLPIIFVAPSLGSLATGAACTGAGALGFWAAKEHSKNARKSTQGKHQRGEARKQKDGARAKKMNPQGNKRNRR